jgi:23S rRNA G2069 N7-methylase RlmK/C1962 C5-methylase RlmI
MLAVLAAKTVAPGGKLIACTNNARFERRIFRQMVLKGLTTAGYKVSLDTLSQYEEPTLDFPHEGEGYLKIIVATFP